MYQRRTVQRQLTVSTKYILVTSVEESETSFLARAGAELLGMAAVLARLLGMAAVLARLLNQLLRKVYNYSTQ